MSRHSTFEEEQPPLAATPQLLAVRDELSIDSDPLWKAEAEGFRLETRCQGQSLWTTIKWPNGGMVATRQIYVPSGGCRVIDFSEDSISMQASVESALGVFRTVIKLPNPRKALLHWRTTLVPTENLILANTPADIYPLDEQRNPFGVAGVVHTAQKGPTGAIFFATVTRPWQGSLLYAQNLTSLNDYFERTKTTPKDRISTRWPELGFLLPPSEDKPILAGQGTVISDAYLQMSTEVPSDKLQAAKVFLDLYAELYLTLPKPDAEFRDWPRLVGETVRDLTHSHACGIEKNGYRYLLAYTGAHDRPPESMVQLAVLVPMAEYATWLGEQLPIAQQILSNLPTFYRPEVKTVVRWLPGEEKLLGKEEHMGEEVMDSWYLYHTYLNLSRLAMKGDDSARELFLSSVDFGIAVAQHFSYHWPVFYNLHTLDAIKSQTKPGRGGEHDVGAQYVHLMMQAWELTGERRFLKEAENAAIALEGLGFDLGYQFNNTSFGAGGLLRLWKETGKDLYRDLSWVCLANIVRNFWLWECDYGYAKNYHTFLGVVPLRDAEYLALYEELEILAAFHDYLDVGGDDVPPSVRLLLCEYCKYLIDRAWYYYPGELPREVIEQHPRSGHINRNLAVPLEDIYEGWQKAGKVGQEVYGAAAPFVFATRHCHRITNVSFRIHCDYPIHSFTVRGKRGQQLAHSGTAQFQIMGDPRCRSRVRIVPDDYTPLPTITLKSRRGSALRKIDGRMSENSYLEFDLPGDAQVTVAWNVQKSGRKQTQQNGKVISARRKLAHRRTPR